MMYKASHIAFLDLGERARRSLVRKRVSMLRLVLALLFACSVFTFAAMIMPSWVALTVDGNGGSGKNVTGAGYSWSLMENTTSSAVPTNVLHLGLSGVCGSNGCQALLDFVHPNHPLSDDPALKSGITRLIIGGLITASSLFLDLIAAILILSAIRIMAPLSLDDPSLVRIKVSAGIMWVSAAQLFFGVCLIVPILESRLFTGPVNSTARWGLCSFLVMASLLLHLVAGFYLSSTASKAIKESRKILMSGRSTSTSSSSGYLTPQKITTTSNLVAPLQAYSFDKKKMEDTTFVVRM